MLCSDELIYSPNIMIINSDSQLRQELSVDYKPFPDTRSLQNVSGARADSGTPTQSIFSVYGPEVRRIECHPFYLGRYLGRLKRRRLFPIMSSACYKGGRETNSSSLVLFVQSLQTGFQVILDHSSQTYSMTVWVKYPVVLRFPRMTYSQGCMTGNQFSTSRWLYLTAMLD